RAPTDISTVSPTTRRRTGLFVPMPTVAPIIFDPQPIITRKTNTDTDHHLAGAAPTLCRLGGLSRSHPTQRFINSSDSRAQDIPSSFGIHPRTSLLRQICAKTVVVHHTAEDVGQRRGIVLPMEKSCGSVRYDFGHRRHIGCDNHLSHGH